MNVLYINIKENFIFIPKLSRYDKIIFYRDMLFEKNTNRM